MNISQAFQDGRRKDNLTNVKEQPKETMPVTISVNGCVQ